ncbi:MAG TPA: S41 family peptidase [Candidatus Saccharimonadales bacterium]|jgi:carboxyl-terminal processing protease|nr:S41 family peptidase [Candidatus Saccharimonadales bacterium]
MSKKLQIALLTISVFIVGFSVVGGLVHASSSAANDGAYSHIQVYSEVLSHVRLDYVEEPNMPLVTNGALHGLLESLDANSSYLSPSEYKAFKLRKTQGKAGVGATVSKRFGYATVVSIIPGGPADKAGVNNGDIIETLDGKNTHEMSLAEVRGRLAGDPGSRLDCTMIRARKVEPQKIAIVRDVVTLPAVQEQMMPDNVGYLKVQALNKGRAQEVAAKIKSLEKAGAKRLVLDLRNSSEGDQEEGVAVANLFLNHGLIAYLQGQKYPKATYNADVQKKITDLPLAVLVNRGTAGAAEIVAAGILENSRGDVVGDKTFGDGSIQKLIEVPDGSALILSVAKYYTPNGKVIQENGITPNVQVTMAADDQALLPDDDESVAPSEEPQKTAPSKESKEDDQLRRAIEVLKNKAKKT